MPSTATVEEHTKTRVQPSLIIHCDDLGLGHCVNEAAFHAFESGCITSGSVMPPCPWLGEVIGYSKGHPDFDLGVHLTLTSEWRRYRWRPVASPEKVQTLVDAEGYMWPDADSLVQHAKLDHVALELHAQIDYVRRIGLVPTHLDSHMFVLLRSWELFSLYLEVAREYSLPILLPLCPGMNGIPGNGRKGPLDCYFAARPEWAPSRWLDHYLACIDHLVPGTNQISVHLARNDEEMKAIQSGNEAAEWNGEWRQRDLDVVRSESFRMRIRAHNVRLTNWGALCHDKS